MKKALLMALLLATTAKVSAGDLNREHVGCSSGWNQYLLSWNGPWSQPLIYLGIDTYPFNGVFPFWAGYLESSGCVSSVKLNAWYQMFGCTGQLCEGLAVVFVPREPCTPPP